MLVCSTTAHLEERKFLGVSLGSTLFVVGAAHGAALLAAYSAVMAAGRSRGWLAGSHRSRARPLPTWLLASNDSLADESLGILRLRAERDPRLYSSAAPEPGPSQEVRLPSDGWPLLLP
jgi:hypothetical protein